MTKIVKSAYASRFGVPLLTASGLACGASAQEVSINYDTLSSLEEPLAVSLGNVTLSLNGLIDAPVTFNLDNDEGDDDVDFDFLGNFEANLETQLPNRWTVGVSYFGQGDGEYFDSAAAYLAGSWGTLIGGNVSGQIHEDTRRIRGVGNAALQFDDFYGGLSDSGGGYLGRFGPTRLGVVVDEDGNFEVGGTFQRPIGEKDYRFSARYGEGQIFAVDGTTAVATKGVSAVAELVYGSSTFDVGIGGERLSTTTFEGDRWYASFGAQRKILGLSVSAEGHYGEVEGQSETSAAVGAAFDIARGLSVNFGVNYEDAEIDLLDTLLFDTSDTRAVVSVRYSF